jgi:hypothetical protein
MNDQVGIDGGFGVGDKVKPEVGYSRAGDTGIVTEVIENYKFGTGGSGGTRYRVQFKNPKAEYVFWYMYLTLAENPTEYSDAEFATRVKYWRKKLG